MRTVQLIEYLQAPRQDKQTLRQMWHAATHLLKQFEPLAPVQAPYELEHHLCLHIDKSIYVSENVNKKNVIIHDKTPPCDKGWALFLVNYHPHSMQSSSHLVTSLGSMDSINPRWPLTCILCSAIAALYFVISVFPRPMYFNQFQNLKWSYRTLWWPLVMHCVSHGPAWATKKQTNTDVQGFICGLYQSVKCTGLCWYNTRGGSYGSGKVGNGTGDWYDGAND